MRVVICDISSQVTHCHFQDLAFALNQSCLLPERRFSFPVSSTGSCYCLSCSRRRAGLIVFHTDTQSSPDPRMNRRPEYTARLSLGRLLVLTSLVTRLTQLVFESTFRHNSIDLSSPFVATFACNKDTLFLYLRTRLRPLPRAHCRSCRRSIHRRHDTNRSSHSQTEIFRTPSSWPAP